MKKKTIAATGITLAAVVALAGGYLWSTANNRPQIATAEAVVAPLSITVDAAGSLATAHSSGVYPPAPGTLAAVKVRDGDSVKAGAVVAVMDTSTLRLAVVEAQAARTAARAQLVAVNNG
ncbi:MAG: biotin/lipoyl-binding protein, partial [Propionicimonas sp.]